MVLWVTAAARVAEDSAVASPNWFFMALGMEVWAAVSYGLHRLTPSTAHGMWAARLWLAAIVIAAAGVVFLVVGIVSWINSP